MTMEPTETEKATDLSKSDKEMIKSSLCARVAEGHSVGIGIGIEISVAEGLIKAFHMVNDA